MTQYDKVTRAMHTHMPPQLSAKECQREEECDQASVWLQRDF